MEDIQYTDCVEISFLNFVQLVCRSRKQPEQVDHDLVERFFPRFAQFFQEHPGIHSSDYYWDEKQGRDERTEWAILTADPIKADSQLPEEEPPTSLPASNSPPYRLVYKIQSRYEIRAEWQNCARFFLADCKGFLQYLVDNGVEPSVEEEDAANFCSKLSEYLSREGFHLELIPTMERESIDFSLRSKVAKLQVKLNGVYGWKWVLWQLFDGDTRLSGHSAISYPKRTK
jgi:hypothetical protein